MNLELGVARSGVRGLGLAKLGKSGQTGGER